MEVELPSPPKIEGVEIRHCLGHLGYAIGDDGTPWSCMKRWAGYRTGAIWLIGSEWKQLTPCKTDGRTGCRLYISIKGKNYFIHRLVLEAFRGPCPDGMEACHYPDRTESNCRLDNLRWDTHESNMDDQRKHGTLARGERQGKSVLTESLVRQIRAMRRDGKTYGFICLELNLKKSTVAAVSLGQNWSWLE